MAYQKGIIRIKGKVGGLSFYENNGKDLVKTPSGVSKEKIEKDPAFKRTRENMSEFGGSAHVAKAFRVCIAELITIFGGRNVVARLTKLFRAVCENGAGVRGARGIEIVNNAGVLNDYNITFGVMFGSVFNSIFTYTANAGRNETVLSVPDFNTSDFVSAPEGATHFRFVNTASILSDYAYSISKKSYFPVNATINGKTKVVYSNYIAIGGMVGGVTTVTATIAGSPTMVATAGLIGCVGIEFFQLLNGNYYLLASENSLKIQNVF